MKFSSRGTIRIRMPAIRATSGPRLKWMVMTIPF